MKLKKKMIIFLCLVLLLALGITLYFVFGNKKENINDKTKVEMITYSVYVETNSLVKLTFKMPNDEEIISDPLITNYELITDKAKEDYKDINIKFKTLSEVIILLGKTLENKDIPFNSMKIYTDWKNEAYFEAIKYSWDVDLSIVDKNELESVINNMISIDKPKPPNNTGNDSLMKKTIVIYGIQYKNLDPNYRVNLVQPIPNDFLKVVIQGNEEDINKIDSPLIGDIEINSMKDIENLKSKYGDFKTGEQLGFSAYLDLKNLSVGNFKVNVTFESENPNIEILTNTSMEVIISEKN